VRKLGITGLVAMSLSKILSANNSMEPDLKAKV